MIIIPMIFFTKKASQILLLLKNVEAIKTSCRIKIKVYIEMNMIFTFHEFFDTNICIIRIEADKANMTANIVVDLVNNKDINKIIIKN